MRSRSCGWLFWAWLTLALPCAASRRAWAAPLPILQGPWVDYFGTFDTKVEPEVVDIDGDGDLDVFAWEPYDQRLRFFRNTGTATSPAFHEEAGNPFGLGYAGVHGVFGDIDGDGDLDAFVGQVDGNTHFFENTGTVTSPDFTWAVANPFGLYVPGSASSEPTLVDIDSDGDLDAFLGQHDLGGAFEFFRNTGTVSSPAFASPPAVPWPFGLTPLPYGFSPSLSFADLDGDGDLDAFETAASYEAPLFLTNSGAPASPSFASPRIDAFGLARGFSNRISLADLDGDGDLDVVMGTGYWFTSSNELRVISNTGSATSPAFVPASPFGLSGTLIALADIDGDADLDAFVDHLSSGDLFLNVGGPRSPAFAKQPTSPLDDAAVFVDIDGDGDLDAFGRSGTSQGVSFCFFQNTGTAFSAGFTPCVKNPFGLAGGRFAPPALADIDGDGDLDFFAGHYSSDVAFFRNTGSATSAAFASAVMNPFGISLAPYAATWAFVDIDGDGDLDAFATPEHGARNHLERDTSFFVNTGTATSPAFAPPSMNPFGIANFHPKVVPVFADIDDDGDRDAFLTSTEGNLYFLLDTVAVPVFADGFELDGTGAWSDVVPSP